nr:PHD finger protein ALFIN-LIKE 4 [Tanacetum cinerariifolium]
MHSNCVFYFLEKDNLCLYGFPSEQWEVNLPVKEVPPELPDPALGINFVRDRMQRKEWLAIVADHNDLWLLSMAFYFGARFGFDKAQRSIFDVINAAAIKHPSNNSNNKSKPNKHRGSEPQAVKYGKVEKEVEEEEEEYDGDASCRFSGDYYDSDQRGSEPQAVKYGKVEEE